MVYVIRLVLVITVLSVCCVACHPKRGNPPEVDWKFQSDGILIHYDAAVDLNRYNGSPHTLMLAVYQLSEASDFLNYAETTDGIRRLLQLYDPDRRKTVSLKNLVDFQTFIVDPGTEKTLKIDRVEDARWVGVVAGYFDIVPQQCSAVFRIPVEQIKEGFILKTIDDRPGDLQIKLNLGAHAIHTVRKSS